MTYVSSGSTESPSFSSICNRAGWALGIVQDRYLKYEKAADQYCGRVVSGLPVYSQSFVVLPPHFLPGVEDEVNEAIMSSFPGNLTRITHLFPVLRMCLASVLYHYNWIRQHLVCGGPLRHLPIFSQVEVMGRLRDMVICPNLESGVLRATGIPAHVMHLSHMERLSLEIQRANTSIEGRAVWVVEEVVKKVEELLEKRSFDQGNITASCLNSHVTEILGPAMAQCLRSSGVLEIVQEYHQQRSAREEGPAGGGGEGDGELGAADRLRPPLPSGWKVPRVGLYPGWLLWWIGNPRERIPPLRFVKHYELEQKEVKKFQDWRSLFRKLTEYLVKVLGDVVPAQVSPKAALAMYSKLNDVLVKLCGAEEDGRCRQLHVSTVSRKIRHFTF